MRRTADLLDWWCFQGSSAGQHSCWLRWCFQGSSTVSTQLAGVSHVTSRWHAANTYVSCYVWTHAVVERSPTCFCCAAASRDVTRGGRPSCVAADLTVCGPAGACLRPAARLAAAAAALEELRVGDPSPWSTGRHNKHTAGTRTTDSNTHPLRSGTALHRWSTGRHNKHMTESNAVQRTAYGLRCCRSHVACCMHAMRRPGLGEQAMDCIWMTQADVKQVTLPCCWHTQAAVVFELLLTKPEARTPPYNSPLCSSTSHLPTVSHLPVVSPHPHPRRPAHPLPPARPQAATHPHPTPHHCHHQPPAAAAVDGRQAQAAPPAAPAGPAALLLQPPQPPLLLHSPGWWSTAG